MLNSISMEVFSVNNPNAIDKAEPLYVAKMEF